jgi:hypothetical protein
METIISESEVVKMDILELLVVAFFMVAGVLCGFIVGYVLGYEQCRKDKW